MRIIKHFILLSFLGWAFNAGAQVPQGASSASMPEQWQLTLDVIKSKAQTLMVKNNGLQVQYQQLIAQVQKLKQSISDGQSKNEQMGLFLKKRNGRTDQQLRIEELTQAIKTKSQQAKIYDGQLGNLQRKQAGLNRNIQQLKYMISEIELRQQAEKTQAQTAQVNGQSLVDRQLTQLRKQLEDENKQEVLLENELRDLKSGDKVQNLNVDALDKENRQLEARLDLLRLQKLQHERNSSDSQLAEANRRMYYKIKGRKDLLKANILAYEQRIDQLRESSMLDLSWALKKKQLIHEMVQSDARNNQMRDKIKVLREDIDVLKDQVSKLEHRVDFIKGQELNP